MKIALAIGAALIAAGNALIEEFDGNDAGPGTAAAPAAAGTEAPKRRGRPPGGGTPAAPTEAPAAGKTEAELRELIRPIVEEGRGEEIKKLILKHGSEIGKVGAIPAANHAAFAKDVEALSY